MSPDPPPPPPVNRSGAFYGGLSAQSVSRDFPARSDFYPAPGCCGGGADGVARDSPRPARQPLMDGFEQAPGGRDCHG